VTHASAPDNIEGERKTVTMLFADLKGSMGLIEDLDPEEARAIVDPALKLMMEPVQRYGGYLAQSTGDGIFALFGAPIAHEDHPQRALYAAVRMQEELKRYSDRIRAEGRIPVHARLGVNTGEVVVRSITTGEGRTEYAPVGHSAGVAARMQALAQVGSIAATEQIRKLCEGYFIFKSLGPTKVKGISEPVNVYEVTGWGRCGLVCSERRHAVTPSSSDASGKWRRSAIWRISPSKATGRLLPRLQKRALASRAWSMSSKPVTSRTRWCWRRSPSRTAGAAPRVCKCARHTRRSRSQGALSRRPTTDADVDGDTLNSVAVIRQRRLGTGHQTQRTGGVRRGRVRHTCRRRSRDRRRANRPVLEAGGRRI